MRAEKKRGCGCLALVTAAVVVVLLIGVSILVFNKYFVITLRENPAPTPPPVKVEVKPVVPAATPQPVVEIEPTPPPTVDLMELKSRMQEWPDEVTLASAAVFPGDVTAPAGTNVKLISAGPEVEVEYQDQTAKLLADQTDLVARILSHRAQAAKELEVDRTMEGIATAHLKEEADARQKEFESVYGKAPSHEDVYFSAKTYLKQVAKDPDSVEMISASPAVPTEYGGRKCWASKVLFRTRDEMGFSKQENGTAYIEGDKAIGYERAQ